MNCKTFNTSKYCTVLMHLEANNSFDDLPNGYIMDWHQYRNQYW